MHLLLVVMTLQSKKDLTWKESIYPNIWSSFKKLLGLAKQGHNDVSNTKIHVFTSELVSTKIWMQSLRKWEPARLFDITNPHALHLKTAVVRSHSCFWKCNMNLAFLSAPSAELNPVLHHWNLLHPSLAPFPPHALCEGQNVDAFMYSLLQLLLPYSWAEGRTPNRL